MKCQNCGANLRYDPVIRKLVCDSCNSVFSAEERQIQNADHAEEQRMGSEDGSAYANNNIDYYLYTCPSCGAELLGTYDTSAVGFCTYCGGQSVIKSRLDRAVNLKYMVPFSKTKKVCCSEYMSLIEKVPFVPNELKDPEHIEAIRGIYIPYYVYTVNAKAHMELRGSERKGDYTDTYHTSSDVQGSVEVPVDASVQMNDDIGMVLLPESDDDVVPFNEGYMTDYYAEMPDVNPAKYADDVREHVKNILPEAFKKKTGDNIDYSYRDLRPPITTDISTPITTLIPAYFLTYRKKNRVCHVIFSGRERDNTLYGMVPISMWKYLLASLGVAAVLFIILTLTGIVIPHNTVLGIMSYLSCTGLYLMMVSMIKGAAREDQRELNKKDKKTISNLLVAIFGCFIITFFGPFFQILALLFTVVMIFVKGIAASFHHKSVKAGSFLYLANISFISIVFYACAFYACTKTKTQYITQYIMYYVVLIMLFAFMIHGLLGMCRQYNLLCTKPLPHFTREGGYNNV